jgi:hypothetical protein
MASTSHSGSDISGSGVGPDADGCAFMAHQVSRIDRATGAGQAGAA